MNKQYKLSQDLRPQDNILDNLTFNDIITASQCNLKEITPDTIRRQALELFEMRKRDFMDLLDTDNIAAMVEEVNDRRGE